MAESRNARDNLGGRMVLIASKVDSKIFFHRDAVVEYMDIKNVMEDLSEEKKRMEQEHHGRPCTACKEILGPVEGELDAANQELLHAREKFVQVKEELVAVKEQLARVCRELDQKNGELDALRKKIQGSETSPNVVKTNTQVHEQHHETFQSKGVRTRSTCNVEKLFGACLHNDCLEHHVNVRRQLMKDSTISHRGSRDDDLQIVRDKLINGLIEIDAEYHISIKEIGVLNKNPFLSACAEKCPPEEASIVASELYSQWQELLNDKSWKPFYKVTLDSNTQVEIIDADDNKLQELIMEWGEGPYKAVTNALVERKEYDVDRPGVFDLWNYKEGRKASLGECIEYMFDQIKQLKLIRRKTPRPLFC